MDIGDWRGPPGLDLLWAQSPQTRSRVGPQLSTRRVVAAAVAVADGEGLEAVSMARVAERLDAATMSLYRHVRNKDELVLLMLETAIGDPPDPPGAGGGWRTRLEGWASRLLERVQRHSWVLDLPLARMAIGPRRASWIDRGLASLGSTPLSEHEKAALVLLVNDFVFSHARLDAQLTRAARAEAAPLLPRALDSRRYPDLAKALASGVFDDSPRNRTADFRFGLERILDGIEHLIAATTPAPGPRVDTR